LKNQPISTPGLVATGIFAFLLAWDEFVLALVFTKTTNSITIPVFISALGSQYIHAFDQIAASGFIASACACLPVHACTQTGLYPQLY
jgi:multiple sugar transport system permease protein